MVPVEAHAPEEFVTNATIDTCQLAAPVIVDAASVPFTLCSAKPSKKRKLNEAFYGKALYLFAGPKRHSSIAGMLRHRGWDITEIDILQGGKQHDLTRAAVRDRLLGSMSFC